MPPRLAQRRGATRRRRHDPRQPGHASHYLADCRYALANRAVRNEVLGGRATALTVVIAGIFDSAWLAEIEAIAAA
jgi:hypothetical protein